MRTISMLELRQDAAKTLDAVRRGERLILTYRGKPVARIDRSDLGFENRLTKDSPSRTAQALSSCVNHAVRA
jgi:antitoxin (DNA-binding transcriptional repressor) of toxin-antitoxin stability system